MDAVDQTPGARGVIPNFFYDIISFILPGAWLVIGGVWTWYGPDLRQYLHCPIPNFGFFRPPAESAPIAALIITVGVLVFMGASSLVGFLLSAFSHLITARLNWKKPAFGLEGLRKFIGTGDLSMLTERFEQQFGFALTDANLNEAGFLCCYYTWRENPTLGLIVTRLNAERVAAQSFFLVSCALFFEDFVHLISIRAFYKLDVVWLLLLLLSAISSWLAFTYHQKKRMYARFQIYLAIVCERPRNLFS